MKTEKYMVKVERRGHVSKVATCSTLEQVRAAAAEFEAGIQNELYKREFCCFIEESDPAKGFHFTIF